MGWFSKLARRESINKAMTTAQIRAVSQNTLVSNWALVAGLQALLILGSLVAAWLLRFDFSLPDATLLFSAAPVLIVLRLVAMARYKLFHGWWRYTGLSDVVELLKAITLGSAMFVVLMRFILVVTPFPRSIYILEALISTSLLAGIRALSRMFAESHRKDRAAKAWLAGVNAFSRSFADAARKDESAKRVMIVGAGFAAEMLIRELKRSGSGYDIAGCVDDSSSKTGIKIHGVPVLATVDKLPTLVAACGVDEILIAVPSATGVQMQRLVSLCQETGAEFKTVPTLQDIITGRVNISHFREVRLEDLLGREPVEIDLESMREQIAGRVVLVTGAAGTIGSELCRQILEFNPCRMLCVDQSETGIFYLQLDLLDRNKSGSRLVFCVADVGDHESMKRVVLEHNPQVMFHAAAYKHVPIMEWNVYGAVRNNVVALLSLLSIAEQGGCQNFVLISSDKAVNPTNVMGVTKRVGELIIAARPTSCMRCVSVRFGNVLGSNGSVIPVLQRQLRNNQQLTVTHPEVRRFFMTTREAVSLVLQASAIGDYGDTLVLDMGTPLRILDVARTLIRLSGKSEDEIGIKFTGLRDGEKLVEELFYSTEDVQPTSFPRIKRIRETHNGWIQLQRDLEELKGYTAGDDPAAIRHKLKQIVPEYSYQLEEHDSAAPVVQELLSPAREAVAAD
jgi:FlaA1/EpsC-like NDP-sugar epimerase